MAEAQRVQGYCNLECPIQDPLISDGAEEYQTENSIDNGPQGFVYIQQETSILLHRTTINKNYFFTSNATMSSTIKTVAIAGASGSLGPAILNALLAANFSVTVLTRETSSAKFPASAKIARVDYNSFDSLVSALRGHDAFVSTLYTGPENSKLHPTLVDACLAAGVKRYLPSEFGSDLSNAENQKLEIFGNKVMIAKYVAEKAAGSDGKLSWTRVYTGPFFDWCIMVGLLVGKSDGVTELYNGGDVKISTTTLADVGKAVVGVLQHPSETENKEVWVQSTVVTQNQLVNTAEKVTGKKLETKVVETAPLLEASRQELKKGSEMNGQLFAFDQIKVAIFTDANGGLMPQDKLWNEKLGLKEMTEEEVKEVVKKYV